MALSAPTEQYAQEQAAQTNTTTLSPTGTIAVGKLLLLFTASSGSNKVPSSVTDDAGNTWVVDQTTNDGTRGVGAVRCQVTAQLTSSSVITITWSNATSRTVELWLQEVSGAATSGAFDQSAVGSGTGTAVATAATGTLARADEIVFGVARFNTTATWTKGGSYSDVGTPSLGLGAGLEYKIVSATTAVTADATLGTSRPWVALVVTYVAASTFGGRTLLGVGG